MSSVITEDINRRPAYNGTKDNGNRLSKDKYGGYLKAKKSIKLFSQVYEITFTINLYDEDLEGFIDEMVVATKACLDTIN